LTPALQVVTLLRHIYGANFQFCNEEARKMFDALKNFITHQPTQREALPGQVPNNADGFSFETDKWTQLKRFLILGTASGSFYVGEQDMTKQNLTAVTNCIDEDAMRVVELLNEISLSGRAPKNDPALFVLAMVASRQVQVEVKGQLITVPTAAAKAAYEAIPKVARTFTHLSHFVTFVRKGKMRGFGRGFRRAIARWFTDKSVEDLVYQAIKYRSRDGFSQKDVAWLCHAGTFLTKNDSARRAVFDYLDYKARPGAPVMVLDEADLNALARLRATESLAALTDGDQVAALVDQYALPMEAVPTGLRGKAVYKAVAKKAGLGWIIRNLGNLGRVGLLSINDGDFVKMICNRIVDRQDIRKSRLHPLSILIALNTYKSGRGFKGSGEWEIVPKVIDALNKAFYKSFKYVEPSGKRTLIAIDVSGSMRGTKVNGTANLSAHEAAAVLAMVAIRAGNDSHIVAFDTSTYPLAFSGDQRIDDVMDAITRIGGGGTDCALPFIYAKDKNLKIDLFVCLTDSETWAGRTHVMPAFEAYRKASGIDAKAINIAMTANAVTNFESNRLCLEVAGFDTTIPEVISLFGNES
jgi:60 kDa SS-A/Ro ribonucleoprotein